MSEGSLELIFDSEVSAGVSAWVRKGSQWGAVVDEQIDDRAVWWDWSRTPRIGRAHGAWGAESEGRQAARAVPWSAPGGAAVLGLGVQQELGCRSGGLSRLRWCYYYPGQPGVARSTGTERSPIRADRSHATNPRRDDAGRREL